jgi:hypothetical protein
MRPGGPTRAAGACKRPTNHPAASSPSGLFLLPLDLDQPERQVQRQTATCFCTGQPIGWTDRAIHPSVCSIYLSPSR